MNFSSQIIKWYKNFKRELPWRETRDPYKIWLSEIILQQTQVKQGLPYYERFLASFPNVNALAEAAEDDIMKLWQGLGYYSRARNLHFAAKQIVKMGKFPNDYNSILSLKGVGEYTAAAISSFAFKLPHAVVDGNVFRLLSRFYGIEKNISSVSGKRYFFDLANSLIDKNKPDIHNQAIMEFGSQMCKAVKPNCTDCPLKDECYAFSHNMQKQFPIKNKKQTVKSLYFDYFFFEFGSHTFIQQRSNEGIWKNLYEFPLIESSKQYSKTSILAHDSLQHWLANQSTTVKSISCYKHVLSHRVIFARFWRMECQKTLENHSFKTINILDLEQYAVSRLTEKFINEILN